MVRERNDRTTDVEGVQSVVVVLSVGADGGALSISRCIRSLYSAFLLRTPLILSKVLFGNCRWRA